MGDSTNVLKNRPVSSALFGATENIYYAELGVTTTSIAEVKPLAGTENEKGAAGYSWQSQPRQNTERPARVRKNTSG